MSRQESKSNPIFTRIPGLENPSNRYETKWGKELIVSNGYERELTSDAQELRAGKFKVTKFPPSNNPFYAGDIYDDLVQEALMQLYETTGLQSEPPTLQEIANVINYFQIVHNLLAEKAIDFVQVYPEHKTDEQTSTENLQKQAIHYFQQLNKIPRKKFIQLDRLIWAKYHSDSPGPPQPDIIMKVRTFLEKQLGIINFFRHLGKLSDFKRVVLDEGFFPTRRGQALFINVIITILSAGNQIHELILNEFNIVATTKILELVALNQPKSHLTALAIFLRSTDHDNITPKEFKNFMGEFCKFAPTLEHLKIAESLLRHEQTVELMQALPTFQQLRSFNARTLFHYQDELTEFALTEFAGAIQKLPKLSTLGIDGALRDDGANVIANAVCRMPRLENVYMVNTDCTEIGLGNLIDGLRNCATLAVLNIDGNTIPDSILVKLIDLVGHLSKTKLSLTTLVLDPDRTELFGPKPTPISRGLLKTLFTTLINNSPTMKFALEVLSVFLTRDPIGIVFSYLLPPDEEYAADQFYGTVICDTKLLSEDWTAPCIVYRPSALRISMCSTTGPFALHPGDYCQLQEIEAVGTYKRETPKGADEDADEASGLYEDEDFDPDTFKPIPYNFCP